MTKKKKETYPTQQNALTSQYFDKAVFDEIMEKISEASKTRISISQLMQSEQHAIQKIRTSGLLSTEILSLVEEVLKDRPTEFKEGQKLAFQNLMVELSKKSSGHRRNAPKAKHEEASKAQEPMNTVAISIVPNTKVLIEPEVTSENENSYVRHQQPTFMTPDKKNMNEF